jgi:hypothetical protein
MYWHSSVRTGKGSEDFSVYKNCLLLDADCTDGSDEDESLCGIQNTCRWAMGEICVYSSVADPDPLVRGMVPDPDPYIIKQK